MLIQSIKLAFAAFVVSLLLLFVFLNLMLGCNDWEQSNCVTPKQFFSYIIG